MELFKLVGKIAVDSSEANTKINEVSQKAGLLATTVGTKMQSAGDKISGIGGKMKPATVAIAGIGTAAVKTYASFESKMSNVQAISGATGDDLIKLSDKAKEMGAKTKFSASESADALSYMAMAGWKTDDMLNGLEGVMNLAAASGEDLASTSDIVTDALTAFGMSANESTHFADILATTSSNANTNVSLMGETFKYVAPVAGSLGYKAEDVAAAVGLMANSGIKASQAGTSLRSLLTNLAKPSDTVEASMKRLGLSLTDSSGKMKPMSQLTEELRDKFSGLTAEQKAQEAASLAGKTGMSGLLAIVNASDKDYKKLTKSIDECDGSSKKMADTMINNLSGQITILKSQLEGVAIQIGEIVVPKIKEFVTHIQGLVDKFSKLDKGTQTTIVKIAGIVAAIAPVLLTVGKLSSGIGKIITLFGRIGGLASPIGIVVAAIAALAGVFAYAYKNNSKFREQVNGLVSGLKATLLPVIEKLKTVFTNLWTGTLQPLLSNLATSFTSTLSQILPVLTNIIQTVLPQLANVIATIVPLIANIVATVLPQLADMINTILPLIMNFVSQIMPTIMSAIQAILPVITNLVQTVLPPLMTIIQSIVGVLMQVIQTVLPPIINIINTIVPIIMNIVSVLSSVLMPIINTVVNILGVILPPIISALGTVITFIANVFINAWNIIKTAWSVAASVFSAIWNKIKVVFGPVAAFFKKCFGAAFTAIKTVFGVLVSVFRGIWNGIKAVFSPVISFFGKIFKGAWNGIKSAFSATVGFFKTLWSSIKSVFSGVGSFFSSVFGVIGDILKAPINLIIKGLNFLINGINKISFDVPDWVPVIGGGKFGFDIPTIPELEEGGVLERGQVGLLEGNGSEAVVPLEKNTGWLDQIALRLAKLNPSSSDGESVQKLDAIITLLQEMAGTNRIEEIQKALAGTDISWNKREIGRLVKSFA